jgi:LmbE family N-acetylglucosaminyl deacetylase
MTAVPSGGVVVVSPHLDDAVLSLASTMTSLTRRGRAVTVVTVFAGDAGSAKPAGGWDRRGGFATEGDAATTRRSEDAEACALVGANPAWLPFSEADYREDAPDDDAITGALLRVLRDADAVFVPGFPLVNPDHAYVARLVLARKEEIPRIALYAEQPYRYLSRGAQPRPRIALGPLEGCAITGRWIKKGRRLGGTVEKRRAILAYRSQISLLGFERDGYRKLNRMLRHEMLHGGEAISWIT